MPDFCVGLYAETTRDAIIEFMVDIHVILRKHVVQTVGIPFGIERPRVTIFGAAVYAEANLRTRQK